MLVRWSLGRTCLALIFSLLSMASVGCDSDEAAPSCAPGASVACHGVGDCAGGQVCEADGHGFGECVCGAPVGPADDGDTGNNGGRGGAGAVGGGGGTNSTDGGTEPDAGGGGGSSAGEDAGEDAGAGDDAGTDAGQDAGVGFGSFSCNPLTDAGCADDERCSWVQGDDSGETRCLDDGSQSAGQACTTDGDGVDDCERGSICIDGACATVCEVGDFVMCAPEGYCTSYAGIFQEGDEVLAGACRLGCDPVTQLTSADEACGDGEGCYYLQSETGTIASCVGTNATSEARTQDAPIIGTVFSNSCAPGYAAITDADGDPVCTALCTPVETWSGSTANIGGEAPHTCADRGAGAGYECRFASYFAKFDHADPLLNVIGLCVNPEGRLWDSNGNGTPETAWPSCADLANTDTDDDDVRDHEKWGCAPVMP